MIKSNNLKGSALLLIAAFIWGIAFVAQNTAANGAPPFLINCLRSAISAVFLSGLLFVLSRRRKTPFFPSDKPSRAACLKGGISCGCLLAISVNFQQFAFIFYPDSAPKEARTGFITAIYVILVPIFSIILKKRISPVVWVAALTAIAGFWLLCFSEGVSGIYLGDLLVFCCAAAFSMHILCVDKFVSRVGGVRLSLLQFAVCAIISGILSLVFELDSINPQALLSVMPEIAYLGIMSSGIAYTLQIIGQRYAEPAVASITMSLESVFAALGGWVISGNALSAREILGCAVVFAAIIIAQLPEILGRRTQKQ